MMSKLFIIEVTTKSQIAVAANIDKVDENAERYMHQLTVPEYISSYFSDRKLTAISSKTIDVSGDDLDEYKYLFETEWQLEKE